MSLMLQEPTAFTKKEMKKEYSDQGLAKAYNVHKKGYQRSVKGTN